MKIMVNENGDFLFFREMAYGQNSPVYKGRNILVNCNVMRCKCNDSVI